MNTRLPARIALVTAFGLLAGCAQATYPSVTFTTSTPLTAPSTSSPTPTPTRTGDEAAIEAQILAYNAWVAQVYADPSVPSADAAKYVTDEDPDYLSGAVQIKIQQFRGGGYTETGSGKVVVQWLKAATDGSYSARICNDASEMVVKDKSGAPVNTGMKVFAAIYVLLKRPDGIWRIAHITGDGSC